MCFNGSVQHYVDEQVREYTVTDVQTGISYRVAALPKRKFE